jgi:CheY-like chemotaxis protein
MDDKEPKDGQNQPPPRVLVLEDDADTLAFLGRLLAVLHVESVPTATCVAARYAAKTLGSFDLLLSDRSLADGDGVELALELKQKHECAVVIMSGYDAPPEGKPQGIDLWLVKPVSLAQLTQAIQSLVQPGNLPDGPNGPSVR